MPRRWRGRPAIARAAERIFQSVKTGLTRADLESADKIWGQIRKTSKEILAVEGPTPSTFRLRLFGFDGTPRTWPNLTFNGWHDRIVRDTAEEHERLESGERVRG